MVVTAAHVNALFVPGFKEWKVDTAAVTSLLGECLCFLCVTYVVVCMRKDAGLVLVRDAAL
jgi:hypothetical protein